MKKSALAFIMSGMTLSGCISAGGDIYDRQARAECDELFDPAAASECRLDETANRQDRRKDRRNARNSE